MRITEFFDRGEFVITAEVGPPKGTNIDGLIEEAKEYLSDYTTRQAQKAIEWARDMAGFFANDFWREDQYE